MKEEDDDDNDDDLMDNESSLWTLPASTGTEQTVLNLMRSSSSLRDITEDNIFATKVKHELKHPIKEDDFQTKNDYKREVVAPAISMVEKAVTGNLEKILKGMSENERQILVRVFPNYAMLVEQIDRESRMGLPAASRQNSRRTASPATINPAVVRILPPAPSKRQKKAISLHQRMENLRKPVTKPYSDSDVYMWRSGGAIESIGTNPDQPTVNHYVMNNSDNVSVVENTNTNRTQAAIPPNPRSVRAAFGNNTATTSSRQTRTVSDATGATAVAATNPNPNSSRTTRVESTPTPVAPTPRTSVAPASAAAFPTSTGTNPTNTNTSTSIATPRAAARSSTETWTDRADSSSVAISTSTAAVATATSTTAATTATVSANALAPEVPPLVQGEALSATNYSLPRARDVVFSNSAILEATRTTLSGRNVVNSAVVNVEGTGTSSAGAGTVAVGVVAEASYIFLCSIP